MVKIKKKERVWQEVQPKVKRKRIRKILREGEEGEGESEQNIENEAEKEDFDHHIQEQSDNIIVNQPIQIVTHISQPKKDKKVQKELVQLCLLLKSALFCQIELSDHSSLTSQRPAEHSLIKQFLSCPTPPDEYPDLLCAYGSPGIGKTYLLKNILRYLSLQQKAEWVNCFSIISDSKLKIQKKPNRKEGKGVQIIVLDEFDQLEDWLSLGSFVTRFRIYLDELQQTLISDQISKSHRFKYILISNKSCQQFRIHLDFLSQIFEYKRIIEIPFLPYGLASVTKIIHSKLQTLSSRGLLFDMQLVDITINKIYTKSQDIRKVLGFIVDNYQLLVKMDENTGKGDAEDHRELKMRMIDKMIAKEKENSMVQNMESHYLKLLQGRQKMLMKNMITAYQKQTKQNCQPYLMKQVYREGKRLNLEKINVDIWLKEWEEMGLLEIKEIKIKNQHFLEKKNFVVFKAPVEEWRQYFY